MVETPPEPGALIAGRFYMCPKCGNHDSLVFVEDCSLSRAVIGWNEASNHVTIESQYTTNDETDSDNGRFLCVCGYSWPPGDTPLEFV